MNNWLTHELAQDIVDKMMKNIPYSINIMNEKGIIIGSGNKNRVGTLHRGAVKALESRKMVEIYKNDQYEKKGTNEPIVIGDEYIGVVGITGEPDEVRPFCKLVKATVSLLIEQSILIGNREAARKREIEFLEILLNEKNGYTPELIDEAEHYHIHLHNETTVVLIRNLEETKETKAILEAYPYFKKQNENLMIAILQNTKNADKWLEQLLNADKHCLLTKGLHLRNVAASYQQARLSLNVAEKLNLPGRYYEYEKLEFLAELSQMNLLPLDPKLRNKGINLSYLLLDTLKTYLHHNGNPTNTAQALMIHRNTLYYRLDRIKKLTGKDPTQMIDLFELTYLLLQQ